MNQTTDHAYGEDVETITSFYIPSTAANTDLNAHVPKHNNTFAIFNRFGDIRHGSEGIYHEDTRYLSRFELTIHDAQSLLLSSAMQDDNSLLTADLANPDLYGQGHLQLARETVHITRNFFWMTMPVMSGGIAQLSSSPTKYKVTDRFCIRFR